MISHCPSAIELQQFLDAGLAEDIHAAIDRHISTCRACQRRLEELVRDRTIDDLVRPVQEGLTQPPEIRFPSPPTERGPLGTFDTFHVAEQLGQGAFGVVYRAFDTATGRDVAIKVLKPEVSAVESHRARFDREAKAAARVHHTNVVSIHHVGLLPGSGLPYLIFEYVPGQTLETRLRRDRVLSPDIAAEILFDVASGLAAIHAEQISGSDHKDTGLVHRDVKPSNIMLQTRPDGGTKALITDFGLARPVSLQRTQVSVSGQILGTLPYMSPEQIRSPATVDGRADIYGLGVVGYEMLVGKRPYDAATPADIIRLIDEAATDAPRRYNELVPVDLETIILKCLAKDPQRRYATAADLAADLSRYRRGEPIQARRVTPVERLRLWYRRKPALASSLAALILVILVAFPTITWKWMDAERQRKAAEFSRSNAEIANDAAQKAALEARKEAAKFSFINRYLVSDLLAASDPKLAHGRQVTVSEVLARASKQLDSHALDDPEIEAFVRLTLGETYQSLGSDKESEQHLRKSLDALSEIRGHEDTDTLRAMDLLSESLRLQNMLEEADHLSANCLKIRTKLLGADAPETLVSKHNRAELLFDLGRVSEAEALCRSTLDARTRVLGAMDPGTITTKNNLATMLAACGKLSEALILRETLVSDSRDVFGPDHPFALLALNNLSVLLFELGRPAEAERASRDCLEKLPQVLGPDHPQTIDALSNLAMALTEQNKWDEAEPIYTKCLAVRREIQGPDHPLTLVALNNLAELHRKQAKFATAEPLYLEFLSIAERNLSPDHPYIYVVKNNLAMTFQGLGKLAEAEPLLREVLDQLSRIEGPNHPHTLATLSNLALVLRMQNKLIGATEYARQSLIGRRAVLPEGHPSIAISLQELGLCLANSGDYREAETVLREALSIRRRAPSLPDELAETMIALGTTLVENHKIEEAETVLREGVEAYRKAFGSQHAMTVSGSSRLGACLAMLGRYEESEKVLLDNYVTIESAPSIGPVVAEETINSLVLLYRKWEKLDRANEWQTKAKSLQPQEERN